MHKTLSEVLKIIKGFAESLQKTEDPRPSLFGSTSRVVVAKTIGLQACTQRGFGGSISGVQSNPPFQIEF